MKTEENLKANTKFSSFKLNKNISRPKGNFLK